MSAVSYFATGSAAERIAEYRKRAEEMYVHAGDAHDDDVREFFMEIALAYTGMADHLESKALADAMNKTASAADQPAPPPPLGKRLH
jgi:hypothetical protein